MFAFKIWSGFKIGYVDTKKDFKEGSSRVSKTCLTQFGLRQTVHILAQGFPIHTLQFLPARNLITSPFSVPHV